MGMMIVCLKVKDFGSWRQLFDAGRPQREIAGLSNERVYCSADDGNELALLMDASDLGKAKEFAASTGRKAAMEKAGVIGTPTDYFAE